MKKGWVGLLCSVLMLGISCDSETYDTGDGPYSYLRADFVEVTASEQGKVDKALTDEGVALQLAPAISAKWVTVVDSAYRALLYYDYKEGESKVVPRSLSQVMVLRPLYTLRPDTLRQDPLLFESAWIGTRGNYLNIGYAVKTGVQTDGQTTKQSIGLRCDTLWQGETVSAVHCYLLHDQRDVPQYYTAFGYMSIPLGEEVRSANLILHIPTYQGEVIKEF